MTALADLAVRGGLLVIGIASGIAGVRGLITMRREGRL